MNNRNSPRQNRRTFLKTSAALGAGFWVAGGVAPRRTYASALDKVQFACIGIGGKGASDSEDANQLGQVVAFCDIDDALLEKGASTFKDAKSFFDYRTMLDELGDKIDAVTVSTPDHTHAVAALHAMRMGKHCFCQKPLTHSIEEARLLATTARERGLVTQMGNQGTALSILRRSAAIIRRGDIGKVEHVHVWTNRPVWPQGMDVKIKEAPDAANAAEVQEWNARKAQVHWPEWIGPAPIRPYSPEIHPFKWRGLWNYGTGALGDMACHTLNMSFMALNLRDPVAVTAKSAPHDGVMYPKSSVIDFEFPELDGRPALKMTWYDGGERPPVALLRNLPKMKSESGRESVYTSAALVVGTEGHFFSPGDYGGDEQGNSGILRPDGTFVRESTIQLEDGLYTECEGGHFAEFVRGIEGQGVPTSNFPDYAGPLTETILAGNLALLVGNGTRIEWDAKNMNASNVPAGSADAVARLIRHEYLNGYSIAERAGAGR